MRRAFLPCLMPRLLPLLLLSLLVLGVPGCPDPGEENGESGGPGGPGFPRDGDPEWLGKALLVPAPALEFVPASIRRPDPAEAVTLPGSDMRIVADEFIVRLRQGASEEDALEAMRRSGLPAKVVGRVPTAEVLQIELPFARPRETLTRLRQNPFVEAADLNPFFEVPPPPPPAPPPAIPWQKPEGAPNDPALSDADPANDWGLRAVRALEAWKVTRGRPEVTIAVVDSGVDIGHEELAEKIVAPYTVPGEREGQDEATLKAKGGSHGTHVAITAAGLAGNGKGTAGVAPGCSIMPVQVMSAQGGAIVCTLVDIVAGLERARLSGADVINLSMGHRRTDALKQRFRAPETRSAAETEMARQRDQYLTVLDSVLERCRAQGVIVVGSAGNDDVPARFTAKAFTGKSICVGAAAFAGEGDYDRWVDSNYDEFVTVAAPGAGIYSGVPGNEYAVWSGSSMASPHVAGVVGLLKSIDRNIGLEEAREILLATATVEVESSPEKPIGRMVDAAAAVRELLRRRSMQKASDPVPTEHSVQIYRATTAGMNSWGTPVAYYRFHTGNIIGFFIDHEVSHQGDGLEVRASHSVYELGSERIYLSLSNRSVFPHPKAGRFVASFTKRIPIGAPPGRYVYVGTIELLDASGTRLAVDQRSVGFSVEPPPLPGQPPAAYDPVRIPVPMAVPPTAVVVSRTLDRDRIVALLREMLVWIDGHQATWTPFRKDMDEVDKAFAQALRAAGSFEKLSESRRAELRAMISVIELRRARMLRELRMEIRSRFRVVLGQEGDRDLVPVARRLFTKVVAMVELAGEVGRLQMRFPECRSYDAANELGERILEAQHRIVPLAGEAAQADEELRALLSR